jgi:CRP/FNR family cyclic AMP-dependent transcriptional regulator
MTTRKRADGARPLKPTDAQTFLNAFGMATTIVKYQRGANVFAQGDACDEVLYLQAGGVKLWVKSKRGKDAVVALLGPGDFFGEECLIGQPLRLGSATTLVPSKIGVLGKQRMMELLHQQHALSERFIAHVLSRHSRIEEALLDQLFNSSCGRGRPDRVLHDNI